MSKVPLENKLHTVIGPMLQDAIEHARGVAPSVKTSEIIAMYISSDRYQQLNRELLVIVSRAIAEQSTFLNDIGIEIDAAITKTTKSDKLPPPFSGQDINNCTSELDQEYMRGFNRCLDDIKERLYE